MERNNICNGVYHDNYNFTNDISQQMHKYVYKLKRIYLQKYNSTNHSAMPT